MSCNRTIMVLKLDDTRRAFESINKLQSNHYGIETLAFQLSFHRTLGCNRTIMVLKQRIGYILSGMVEWLQSNHYGIETRSVQGFSFGSRDRLQSNHYGIETFLSLKGVVRGGCLLQSNHYGIETNIHSCRWICYSIVAIEPLWYWNSAVIRLKDMGIDRCNRTIMVLKPRNIENDINCFRVLQSNHYGIETRLNIRAVAGSISGCNRTIMVLKRRRFQREWPLLVSCNRTIMVLKPPLRGSRSKPPLSCNRTIMVLKLYFHAIAPLGTRVAIEPLWYWNSLLRRRAALGSVSCNRTIMVLKLTFFILSRACSRLQSNHYGIET